MAIKTTFDDQEFGVGDNVRIIQTVREADKERLQSFSGVVISIKGRGENKSFTVRRIGANKVGIERIFPVKSPTVKSVEVLRKGSRGVKHAKLFYMREKSKKDVEKIFQRASRKFSKMEKPKREEKGAKKLTERKKKVSKNKSGK